MVNTPAHPGPFDPLGRAHPNQPFFPLMGGDEFGPPLVEEWADRTRRKARFTEDEKTRAHLFAKATEAEEIAWAMREWEKHGPGAATPVPAARATYSGEPAADEHRWKQQLLAGTAALRNAAFHLSEAAAGLDPQQAAALLATVETVNRIAAAYEPKRASYGAQSELPLTYAEIGVA